MAIAPTGAIYKSLVFDGEDSRNYGVYITGEAVFDAPEREVEMVAIPGRNGAFALDQRRFENIEVSYPAGIFADNETDFAQAISDFRNYLCSKKGYCRLVDEYNPNEYRMAIYKSGLEVTPTQLKAGQFTITFDCKPQRFLTSGETAVTVTSGSTITNPTLFDASPLLEVKGYGTININSDAVTLKSIPMGDIPISPGVSGGDTVTSVFDSSNLITGNSIYSTQKIRAKVRIQIINGSAIESVAPSSIPTDVTAYVENQTSTSATLVAEYSFSPITYKTTVHTTRDVVFQIIQNGVTTNVHVKPEMWYYTSSDTLELTITTENISGDIQLYGVAGYIPPYSAYSTKNITGNPAYIDLDIGEAWNEDSGSPVSINNALTLPAKLPVLESGTTTITFDNTITSLKVRPRWWKI